MADENGHVRRLDTTLSVSRRTAVLDELHQLVADHLRDNGSPRKPFAMTLVPRTSRRNVQRVHRPPHRAAAYRAARAPAAHCCCQVNLTPAAPALQPRRRGGPPAPPNSVCGGRFVRHAPSSEVKRSSEATTRPPRPARGTRSYQASQRPKHRWLARVRVHTCDGDGPKRCGPRCVCPSAHRTRLQGPAAHGRAANAGPTGGRARMRGRLVATAVRPRMNRAPGSSRASAPRTGRITSLDSSKHPIMGRSRPGWGTNFAVARKANDFTRDRSAATGRFVERGRAKPSPRTTVTERFAAVRARSRSGERDPIICGRRGGAERSAGCRHSG